MHGCFCLIHYHRVHMPLLGRVGGIIAFSHKRIARRSRASAMIQVLRVDSEVLAVFSDVLEFLVPLQGLPHVKCILSSFRLSRWVVSVVVNNAAVYAIAAEALARASFSTGCTRLTPSPCTSLSRCHCQPAQTSRRTMRPDCYRPVRRPPSTVLLCPIAGIGERL
jgi:hypothetical protein